MPLRFLILIVVTHTQVPVTMAIFGLGAPLFMVCAGKDLWSGFRYLVATQSLPTLMRCSNVELCLFLASVLFIVDASLLLLTISLLNSLRPFILNVETKAFFLLFGCYPLNR